MRQIEVLIAAIAIAIPSSSSSARGELPALIPREVLLGNPERTSPSISPDGKRLGWLAPDSRNVLQVWVQTLGKNDTRVVTADKSRGIQNYGWAFDSKTILYAQDVEGDENLHQFAVELATNKVRDLTPWPGVRAERIAANPKFPGHILGALNRRDLKLMDVYRIDLGSGLAQLATKNPGDVEPRLAVDRLSILP